MEPNKIITSIISLATIGSLITAGYLLKEKGTDAMTLATTEKGSVLTAESVNVSFQQVGGKIIKLPVQEEKYVKKGDILMILDSTDVDLEIAKSKEEIAQLDVQIEQAADSIEVGYQKAATQEKQANIDIEQAKSGESQANVSQEQSIAALAQSKAALAQSKAAKTQAEASKRQAEAFQKDVENGSRQEDIKQQQLAVESAQKSYENAKTEYNRIKGLYESGLDSKSNLDKVDTSVTLAKKTVQQQQEALQKLKAGATAEEREQAKEQTVQATQGVLQAEAGVAQAEAGVAQAEAGVAQAGENIIKAQLATEKANTQIDQVIDVRRGLENQELTVESLEKQKDRLNVQLKTLQVKKKRLTLKAPQNGKITKVFTEVGENIAAGTPVIMLETNELYYDLYVDESQATKFKAGQKVVGHVDAISKDLTGKVRYVTSAPAFTNERMSREKGEADITTFQVRVYVTKTDQLLPGMTIEVDTNAIATR